MTTAKASALIVGFVGAVALGVWIGPYVTDRMQDSGDAPAVQSSAPANEAAPAERPAKARASRAAKARRSTHPAAAASNASVTRPEVATPSAPAVEASAPELHSRLKPVLNRGTKMEIAAEGFRNAEQFATVAHAARNTSVPFVVLKHRMLNEGKTLEQAIRESKPELDAPQEVSRARAEAKQDLAAIAG